MPHEQVQRTLARLPYMKCRWGRHFLPFLLLLLCAASLVRAELPLARLDTIFPPGGQSGTKLEVTLSGRDLDGVNRLLFSHPGISSIPVASASKFLVTVDSSVPPGLYDVRAAGLFGVSNPRTFEIGRGPTVVAKSGNSSFDKVIDLSANSTAYGLADAGAEQFYRAKTQVHRSLTVTVSSTQLESKMEPITVVCDTAGHELGRSRRSGDPIQFISPFDGICFVRIHDLLYRGGAGYFYRVRVSGGDDARSDEPGSLRWPLPPAAAFLPCIPTPCLGAPAPATGSGSAPKTINPPCEIDGLFRTAKQKDVYTFDAPAGSVYWVEIVSQRLGQDTSPFMLVQRVEQNAKSGEKVTDVQEVYAPTPPRAIPEFPLDTRDPVYRLEAKQPGTYRLVVRDVFARDRNEHPAVYRLEIRRETPDFELVAIVPSPPPEPADSKDVPVWTTLLRRGGTSPVKVIAVRRDGFSGPIFLHVGGLPDHVTAGPAIIPEGAAEATILLQAQEDVRNWVGPISITGVGRTAAGDLSRAARPGTVSFSEYDAADKALSRLRSRLSDQFMVAVSDVEPRPISIMPTQAVFQGHAGGKVTLSFSVKGGAPFSSPVVLNLAGHPAAAKQLTVDPKSNKASVELDLGKAKLPPGQYSFFFVGQAKIKYPDNAALRAAKVALMNAEAPEPDRFRETMQAGRSLFEAIKGRNLDLTTARARSVLSSEWSLIRTEQSVAAAVELVDQVAAHAPVAEVNTSIFSGGFELDVTPAVAK